MKLITTGKTQKNKRQFKPIKIPEALKPKTDTGKQYQMLQNMLGQDNTSNLHKLYENINFINKDDYIYSLKKENPLLKIDQKTGYIH